MSELKATTVYDAYWKAISNGDNSILVYPKSEADKVIARHKYKRCLAMARWCDASMAYFGEFYDDASKQMVTHYYKWSKRWLELAEKFKEAK